jgi:hypothetical protein
MDWSHWQNGGEYLTAAKMDGYYLIVQELGLPISVCPLLFSVQPHHKTMEKTMENTEKVYEIAPRSSPIVESVAGVKVGYLTCHILLLRT